MNLKKIICLLLLCTCLAAPASAQKWLKISTKLPRNLFGNITQKYVPRSAFYQKQFELMNTSIASEQLLAQKRIEKVLKSNWYDVRRKVERVAQVNAKAAIVLSLLQKQSDELLDAWGDALLEERPSSFLPPVREEVLPLFDVTNAQEIEAIANDPTLWKDWLKTLVPLETSELPVEVPVILSAVHQHFEELEQLLNAVMSDENAENLENGMLQALQVFSQRAAYDLMDVVYLCELFPDEYENAFTDLAAAIDSMPAKTAFVKYLRKQLPGSINSEGEHSIGFKISHE